MKVCGQQMLKFSQPVLCYKLIFMFVRRLGKVVNGKSFQNLC